MEGNEGKLVLSARDVARELGVTSRSVSNLRRAGLLTGTCVARGPERSTWRYLPEDVLDYLAAINREGGR